MSKTKTMSKTVLDLNEVTTAWFGIPGAKESSSSKVHLVSKATGKPVCGSRLSARQVYQFCAAGANFNYLECKHCRVMAGLAWLKKLKEQTVV